MFEKKWDGVGEYWKKKTLTPNHYEICNLLKYETNLLQKNTLYFMEPKI